MLDNEIARPRSFTSGPVLDYWLGRCEGFVLTSAGGRQLGTVEEAVLDESGRARALVVRTPVLGRRRIFATGAVGAVVPAGETLSLRPTAHGGPHRRPRLRQAGGRAIGVSTHALGASAARTAPHVRKALLRLLRTLAALLTAASTAARWASGRIRRQVPVAARRARSATWAGASWTWPRLARAMRMIASLLVGLVLLLVAVLRGIVVATRTYWALVAREAARRRAAT